MFHRIKDNVLFVCYSIIEVFYIHKCNLGIEDQTKQIKDIQTQIYLHNRVHKTGQSDGVKQQHIRQNAG